MKPKYKTAKQLGILPAERAALIDFVKAPHIADVIAVGTDFDAPLHKYDQEWLELVVPNLDGRFTCDTGGCVAGYVMAHADLQGIELRGERNVYDYTDKVWGRMGASTNVPFLQKLYEESQDQSVEQAKKVVDHALKTGEVNWRLRGKRS